MTKTKQKKNSEWGVKKLGGLCELSIGKTPPRGDKKFWDTEKKTNNIWLSIADLKNTDGIEIFDSKEYISEDGAKLFSIVKKGTLLVSFKLTLGRLAFAGTDLRTNEAIAALNNLSDEIDKNYLYYFLSFFDWSKAAEGEEKVKGKTLNKAKLKEIEISFPKSLDEQRRIVGILDRSFEAIEKAKENAEKNLQNAKELFDSYLQKIFSEGGDDWEEKKLGEVCDVKSSRRVHKSDWKDNGIPFYRAREIAKLANHGFVENDLFISEELFETLTEKNGYPQKGDIVISAVGTLGKCYVVKKEDVFYIKDASVLWFANFNTVLPEYIEYLFQSELIKEQVINGSMGATVGTLTITRAKNIKIPITSLEKQKEIVEKLDQLSGEVERLEAILRSKIAGMDELKKSILEKAFSGEL